MSVWPSVLCTTKLSYSLSTQQVTLICRYETRASETKKFPGCRRGLWKEIDLDYPDLLKITQVSITIQLFADPCQMYPSLSLNKLEVVTSTDIHWLKVTSEFPMDSLFQKFRRGTTRIDLLDIFLLWNTYEFWKIAMRKWEFYS